MNEAQKIETLQEVLGKPESFCNHLLQMANGNLEMAINLGVDGGITEADVASNTNNPSSSGIRQRHTHYNLDANPTNNTSSPSAPSFDEVHYPHQDQQTTNVNANNANTNANTNTNANYANANANANPMQFVSSLLFSGVDFFTASLRYLLSFAEIFIPFDIVSLWFGPSTSIEAELTAAAGELQLPDIVSTDPSTQGTNAQEQRKPILLYIHAPFHKDSAPFVKDVLCSNEVRTYLNENVLFCSCLSNSVAARKITQELRGIRSFPFAVLLTPRGQKLEVVGGVHAMLSPNNFLQHIMALCDRAAVHIVAEHAHMEEIRQSQQLREEQNREYEESLRKDQEKERKRKEELQKQREELEKSEKEEEERIKKEKEFQEKKEEKKNTLPDEPSADEERIRIAIKLPSGGRIQRFFRPTDPAQLLFDFVYAQDKEEIESEIFINKSRPLMEITDKTLPLSHFCPNNLATMFVCHYHDAQF